MAKEVKSVPAIASGLLKSDDRALAELNELSLSRSVRQEDALDVDELQGRVDRLTHALHHFRAGAVKDRLDRIYLESLRTADLAGGIHNAPDVSDPPHETAKEELSSLYEEIDDMVTMVVAHDHGNPLRVALEDIRRAQTQERDAADEKVCVSLLLSLDTYRAFHPGLYKTLFAYGGARRPCCKSRDTASSETNFARIGRAS
jgi:hypothetical protein